MQAIKEKVDNSDDATKGHAKEKKRQVRARVQRGALEQKLGLWIAHQVYGLLERTPERTWLGAQRAISQRKPKRPTSPTPRHGVPPRVGALVGEGHTCCHSGQPLLASRQAQPLSHACSPSHCLGELPMHGGKGDVPKHLWEALSSVSLNRSRLREWHAKNILE